MSRYTGPRLKVMRALGTPLSGLSRKSIDKRPNPPGQHSAKLVRKSDFGKQLQEKQKIKYNYGLTERQMRRVVAESRQAKGNTGEKMLELLERRLDNFVFRAGFAPTLLAARQLVGHRHVLLNGKVATIPSIRIRAGDEISLKPAARSMPLVRESVEEPALERPEWIAYDPATQSARVTRLPLADEAPLPVAVQQVVEYRQPMNEWPDRVLAFLCGSFAAAVFAVPLGDGEPALVQRVSALAFPLTSPEKDVSCRSDKPATNPTTPGIPSTR